MNDDETADVHPLQKLVTGGLILLGRASALMLLLLTAFSLFLVVTSAFTMHEVLGVVSLLGAIGAWTLMEYVYRLNRVAPIIITNRGRRRQLDNYTFPHLLLIGCGFIQTLFWVIDPDNSIHEPRSVFIIAVAGVYAYFRSEYIANTYTECL